MLDSTVAVNGAANCLAFSGSGTFNLGGLSGSSSLALSNTSSTAIALQVGSNNASTTYAGVLSGPGRSPRSAPVPSRSPALTPTPAHTTISNGTLFWPTSTPCKTARRTVNAAANGLSFAPDIGTFYLGGLAGSGNIALADVNAAAVSLQVGSNNANTTYSGTLSGPGNLTQAGTGTLILTGSNTYSGGTTILAGTLQIDNGGTTGSIAGNVLDNGSLAFKRSDILTYGGIVSGSGSLTQMGPGTLILTGSNTYSGSTTISAGTLQIDNGGTTGNITGNVLDNGSLAFNRSDILNFGGVVSGSGSLAQMGPGTLILTAANTYSGGTTISGGTLQIDSGGISGSITGNVTNNAVLAFNRADNYAFAGNISGSGSLIMNGPGALALTGSIVSGQVILNQGQIVAGPGSVTSGDLTIAAGATVYVHRQQPLCHQSVQQRHVHRRWASHWQLRERILRRRADRGRADALSPESRRPE